MTAKRIVTEYRRRAELRDAREERLVAAIERIADCLEPTRQPAVECPDPTLHPSTAGPVCRYPLRKRDIGDGTEEWERCGLSALHITASCWRCSKHASVLLSDDEVIEALARSGAIEP